jgi:hypothetical protein
MLRLRSRLSGMPGGRARRASCRAALPALAALVLATASACKRSSHPRVASYVPPPVPAGFGEQTGSGWRIAVPSTWKDSGQKGGAVWALADPQPVEDFHANVNVVTESFGDDSYDYARASEAALRRDARTTVESVREDVVDGDPTLIVESRLAPQPPSTVPYRIMLTALSSRGTGYVVACAVSVAAFERYRTTCDSILHSFAVQR